jgi:nitrite reductase (NADH) small subunit
LSWTFVCKLQDIPVLGARRVQRAQGMDVALFRNEADEVFALLDRCPHKGGPLSQGIVTEHGVACPLHNWTIDLRTGQAAAPDEGQAPVFQVQREGDAVLLSAHELATLATDLQPPRAGPCTRAHTIPIAVA